MPLLTTWEGLLSRVVADPVEVELGADVPAVFRWRGRRYQVREVLAHWWESAEWWRAATGDACWRWWRVEAVRQGAAGPQWGVFDLRYDETTGSWSLGRLVD